MQPMDSIVAFRKNLSDYLSRVAYGGERIPLARKGKPTAALVSIDDLRTLEALEDAADLKAALKARKEKGEIPWETVKARLKAKRRHARAGDTTEKD